jgi:D-alanyl-D-alanine endopeptidase (penicillin-binding protein 7)
MMLQTEVGGNRVLMVVLNSTSNNNRIIDMKRMRDWYERQLGVKEGSAKLPYNLM